MIVLGTKSRLSISFESYEFQSINTHWDDFINVYAEYCIEGIIIFK